MNTDFLLGFLCGFIFFGTSYAIVFYHRTKIGKVIDKIEDKIDRASGNKQRGFIIEPDSDADEARAEIIARNRAEGKDTKFEELI